MDKKYVRLTQNLIEKVFDECNEAYFDNQVEKPFKFELWTPWKRCVGWVRAAYPKPVVWRMGANGVRRVAFFHINNRYNWTLENLRKVVVHEMIHLHIKDYLRPLGYWERKFRFLRKEHGDDFKQVMNELNAKYGLDITVKAPFMKKELKRKHPSCPLAFFGVSLNLKSFM